MNTDESLSIQRDVQFDHYTGMPVQGSVISGVVRI